MTADRIKKIALAVLAATAVYVWWGNLKLLAPNQTAVEESSASYQRPVKPNGTLAYRAPRVNPFMTITAADLEPAVDTAPARPASLRRTWRLVGLVSDKRSAAILKDTQNATMVIQPHDSLSGWIVDAVGRNFVVAKKDTWRDTLWLWHETGQ